MPVARGRATTGILGGQGLMVQKDTVSQELGMRPRLVEPGQISGFHEDRLYAVAPSGEPLPGKEPWANWRQ